jgi:hypothetical protein
VSSPAPRPDAGEARPWERPGVARRDAEPHRGGLLGGLAGAALLGAVGSVCTCLPALVVLPFAVLVFALARHDLARMDAGTLDPEGWNATERARLRAAEAAWISLVPFLLVVAFLLLNLLH